MSAAEVEEVVITKPGFVYGMTDETYHGDAVPGGSLSSTFARLLTDPDTVPVKADAIRRNRKPSKAMEIGKAAHAHALGAGPRLIVWQHDGCTKAGKEERLAAAPLLATEAAVLVSEEEQEQIHAMAVALREHDEIMKLLTTCKSEVSAFWQENGIWCRARYDMLGDCAWDYKTTDDVSREGFRRHVERYGYHQQADLYLRGLKALGHKAAKKPFRFICQEKLEPYLVQIHEPDTEAMWAASVLNDKAMELFAEHQRTGVWPGYPSLYAEPTGLSPSYYARREDDLGMEIGA